MIAGVWHVIPKIFCLPFKVCFSSSYFVAMDFSSDFFLPTILSIFIFFYSHIVLSNVPYFSNSFSISLSLFAHPCFKSIHYSSCLLVASLFLSICLSVCFFFLSAYTTVGLLHFHSVVLLWQIVVFVIQTLICKPAIFLEPEVFAFAELKTSIDGVK